MIKRYTKRRILYFTFTYLFTAVLVYRRGGGAMQLFWILSHCLVLDPHHLDVSFFALFLLQGTLYTLAVQMYTVYIADVCHSRCIFFSSFYRATQLC